LEYVVTGAIAGVRFPPLAIPDRMDGLWNTTCFEAFFAKRSGGYVEFNFAPSRNWACYKFEGYREGMAPALDLAAPNVFVEFSEHRFSLVAFVELADDLADPIENAGLSAVIEEAGGHKSYWAIAHPPGKPDFHHATCFAATLPAPEAP